MSKIILENHGKVALVRLSDGVINPISPEMIEALSAALAEVKQAYRGLVLAGGEKFFSIGLDLPRLLACNRQEMVSFWRAFNGIVLDLYTLPMPTACAIAGHATAGGTVFALTCDFRLAAPGRKLIGLNEVQIGLPVPFITDLMLRQLAGDRQATDLMYHGRFMSAEDTVAMGIVDEVVAEDKLEARSLAKIAELAAFSPVAFAAIKATRIEAVLAAYARFSSSQNDRFLDCWFDPATRALLEAAAEKF